MDIMAVKKRAQIKEDNSKGYAFITTFFGIIGFIIAILAWKDDEYVMFYAKQSLVIFIGFLIGYAATFIPFIGRILNPIITLLAIVLWIFSWIYALSGEKKQVPVIGEYAENLKL